VRAKRTVGCDCLSASGGFCELDNASVSDNSFVKRIYAYLPTCLAKFSGFPHC
jgi:hypothetical protein